MRERALLVFQSPLPALRPGVQVNHARVDGVFFDGLRRDGVRSDKLDAKLPLPEFQKMLAAVEKHTAGGPMLGGAGTS